MNFQIREGFVHTNAKEAVMEVKWGTVVSFGTKGGYVWTDDGAKVFLRVSDRAIVEEVRGDQGLELTLKYHPNNGEKNPKERDRIVLIEGSKREALIWAPARLWAEARQQINLRKDPQVPDVGVFKNGERRPIWVGSPVNFRALGREFILKNEPNTQDLIVKELLAHGWVVADSDRQLIPEPEEEVVAA